MALTSMGLTKTVVRIVNHGKKVLENILQKGEGVRYKDVGKPEPEVKGQPQGGRAAENQAVPRSSHVGHQGVLSEGYKQFVKGLGGPGQGALSAEIRRNATEQFQKFFQQPFGQASRNGMSAGARWSHTGGRLPLYAFVGLTVSTGGAQAIKEEELYSGFKNICNDISAVFKAAKAGTGIIDNVQSSLDQYEVGPLIAKGCNSAVYMVRQKPEDKEADGVKESVHNDGDVQAVSPDEASVSDDDEASVSDDEGDFVMVEEEDDFIMVEGSGADEKATLADVTSSAECDVAMETAVGQDDESDMEYRLAMKMMFNFESRSNATDIWRTMKNEAVPATEVNLSEDMMRMWENVNHVRKRRRRKLPAHPNIVDIRSVFVDDVPLLDGAFDEYPDALPERLYEDGAGRNKTMFIIMRRYDMTLREYLHHFNPTIEESLVLLTQLVQAVVHINNHQVAHRDIKSDNILVTMRKGQLPLLVLSDFGCCLAEEDTGLRVQYFTDQISKGGNGSLMAPEIAQALPGGSSILDYRCSDLWAVGAVAYELFKADNPFYRTSKGMRLESSSYAQTDLPDLPHGVPASVSRLVKAMLTPDPSRRPDAQLVAHALCLILWAPQEWYSATAQPSATEVMRWLVTLTAFALCQRSTGDAVEQTLMHNFLSDISFGGLMAAVHFLCNMD